MAKNSKKYSNMRIELDEAMSRLESGELDIDEAIAEFKKAQELIEYMEEYLKTAKNSIKQLKK